jgi:hypothetical protein
MAMSMDAAIERAETLCRKHSKKYYVIAEPDRYDDIFTGRMYKVLDAIDDDQVYAVVYETGDIR